METRLLILKMKRENHLWGSRRIRDELLKLSIEVSHETVSRLLNRHRKTGDIKPVSSWKRFLKAHWDSLFACDFFTVDIFGFRRFYVFFIMELKSRGIARYGITSNLAVPFLRNQFSAFEHEYPGSTVIHDNSPELRLFQYGQYNIKDIAIAPYSPNMNAYAERFIRSVRRKCLDHFVIFTYGQLHRIMRYYVEYHNNYRPHQGLKGIPSGSTERLPKTGTIKRKPLLFGLHGHYYKEAV